MLWQRTCPGNGCSWSGTATNASRIGTEGGLATMPTGFTVSSTDNVIVAEVFYGFTPFFWRQMPAGTLYHIALTRPRLSNLTTICAFHHQRGIHKGLVRCTGEAPHALRFELGRRSGRAPLLVYGPGEVRMLEG